MSNDKELNEGAIEYLRRMQRNTEAGTYPVRWFTACHDCGWMGVFYTESVAQQSSEVHSEVLKPDHTSFVGNIAEQLEAEE